MNAPVPAPSVYEQVIAHYTFPPNIKKRAYQVRVINDLGPRPRAGYYLDQGTGKTFCATVASLYKLLEGADHVVCLMPPILITGWKRWLDSIVPKPSVLVYRTPHRTPKQKKTISAGAARRALPIEGDFILMSLPIFKKDFAHLYRHFMGKKVVVLVDEATSIKNIESDNHRMVHLFSEGRDFMALTGTPLSTPMDGYAFCKFVAPSVYRGYKQFENLHVAETDYFDKPEEWKNLDLLAQNMTVNAWRILRQEALPDLPPVQFDPLFYELDEAHYALYAKLAEEQILALENGGKIDGTSESALFNQLQQIVVNYDHFTGNPKHVSKAIELVEEVLEELNGRKLIIFAKYRMTNARLLALLQERFNAVAVYGAIPPAQQRRNIDRFIDDPACLLGILQPTSAGYGVDGLQKVCSDVLFLELPDIPRDFHQSVARIWRDGLQYPCHVRIAIAEGTLQYGRLLRMMDKDALVGKVCRNFRDLRDLIFARNQPDLVIPADYQPGDYR